MKLIKIIMEMFERVYGKARSLFLTNKATQNPTDPKRIDITKSDFDNSMLGRKPLVKHLLERRAIFHAKNLKTVEPRHHWKRPKETLAIASQGGAYFFRIVKN